jgi:multidrug efflux pump subunit AcrB
VVIIIYCLHQYTTGGRHSLKQAIIEAGAVRTTPILQTADAVMLGVVIILFE